MEDSKTNDGLDVFFIPPNFKSGTAILGFNVRMKYALQSIPFIAIAVLIVMLTEWDGLTKVLAITISALALFVLAARGVNNDSLFGFFKSLVLYKRQRKIYLYNSSLKDADQSNIATVGAAELPRDKLIAFINRHKTENVNEASEDYIWSVYDKDNLEFEDEKRR